MWPRAATQNMCVSLMVLNVLYLIVCNWITDWHKCHRITYMFVVSPRTSPQVVRPSQFLMNASSPDLSFSLSLSHTHKTSTGVKLQQARRKVTRKQTKRNNERWDISRTNRSEVHELLQSQTGDFFSRRVSHFSLCSVLTRCIRQILLPRSIHISLNQ